MKKIYLLIVLIASSLALFASCSTEVKKEPIDGKVSFAVYERVYSLAGTQPIGFDPKNKNVDWTGKSYEKIQSLADPWLKTLKPTHEMNAFPLKSYLTLYYSNPNDQNENIYLYLPYNESNKDAHENIILKGTDNGEEVFYVFKGGEKETSALIKWMRKNEPK